MSHCIASHLLCDESVQRLDSAHHSPVKTRWSLFDPNAAYRGILRMTIHTHIDHKRGATLRLLPMTPNLTSLTLTKATRRTSGTSSLQSRAAVWKRSSSISRSASTTLRNSPRSEWLSCLDNDEFARLLHIVFVFRGPVLTDAKGKIEGHVRDAHKDLGSGHHESCVE
ncbi:hypothetical protein BC835DRAFT_360310 [Cytidiella melzeri]|nr:hypothetical protein BC835DRAFT_360310 [Cytidiella melzeri]